MMMWPQTELNKFLLIMQKKLIAMFLRNQRPFPQAREQVPSATLIQRMGTRDEGLDNVEPEKIGVINDEIKKFRETMKIREAEKEEEAKKRTDRPERSERS